MKIGFERLVVSLCLVAPLAVVAAHAAAMAALAPDPLHPRALLALAAIALLPALLVSRSLARRLPASLDGLLRRRPARTLLWGALGFLALVQTTRLSVYMVDPSQRWAAALPGDRISTDHMCVAAYVYAADLSRRGVANVYDEAYYPSFSGVGQEEAPVTATPVAELGPHVYDAFEYPPPFLLLPRAALALTNHFLVIRSVWFAIQVIAFGAVAALLARWIGGREGLRAALVLPAVWISIPTMFALQFGQFQVAAIVLAVFAMLLFDQGRLALGGALLAVAIVSKIFPGLLLVYLLFRRRYREVGFTIAAALIFSLGSAVVLGRGPFDAFLRYQLPRIASGDAFSFFEGNSAFVAVNDSIYGLAFKLKVLGAPGMSRGVGATLSWAYSVGLVGLSAVAARRGGERLDQASVWLALLNLASLRSPFSPASYAVVGTLWLMTLLTGWIRGSRRRVALVVGAWILLWGLPPIPGSPRLSVLLSLIGQGLMIGVNLWAVLRARPAPMIEDDAAPVSDGSARSRSTAKSTNARIPPPYVLDRDGCPIHYWQSEQGNGPLIVFTHGAGADHHMFDAQIAALNDHYATLAWDVRGHGQSRPFGAGFSIRTAVADLIAILDGLRVQQAIFVGQSMGGNIAQELVCLHPERVAALVLVDCACNTFPLSAFERLMVRLTPAILRLYPYETLLRQSAKAAAVKPDVQQYLYDAMRRLSKDEVVMVLRETMACLRDDAAYRIPKPFLLVRGEHDRTGAITKQATQWAAREPQCRSVIIPDAGHCANQDNPERFNQIMLEFLREHAVKSFAAHVVAQP